MKLGRQCNYHKGQTVLRYYAYVAFSVIVKSSRTTPRRAAGGTVVPRRGAAARDPGLVVRTARR